MKEVVQFKFIVESFEIGDIGKYIITEYFITYQYRKSKEHNTSTKKKINQRRPLTIVRTQEEEPSQ